MSFFEERKEPFEKANPILGFLELVFPSIKKNFYSIMWGRNTTNRYNQQNKIYEFSIESGIEFIVFNSNDFNIKLLSENFLIPNIYIKKPVDTNVCMYYSLKNESVQNI